LDVVGVCMKKTRAFAAISGALRMVLVTDQPDSEQNTLVRGRKRNQNDETKSSHPKTRRVPASRASRQIPSKKKGLTFARDLRSISGKTQNDHGRRIRDQEPAQLAIQSRSPATWFSPPSTANKCTGRNWPLYQWARAYNFVSALNCNLAAFGYARSLRELQAPEENTHGTNNRSWSRHSVYESGTTLVEGGGCLNARYRVPTGAPLSASCST